MVGLTTFSLDPLDTKMGADNCATRLLRSAIFSSSSTVVNDG